MYIHVAVNVEIIINFHVDKICLIHFIDHQVVKKPVNIKMCY